MNAVAGGGSFIAFPALLFTGVPAIPANATNTLSLWVGTTASGGAYPQKLSIPKRVLIPLGMTSLVGGLSGAILLIHTKVRAGVWMRRIAPESPPDFLARDSLAALGRHLALRPRQASHRTHFRWHFARCGRRGSHRRFAVRTPGCRVRRLFRRRHRHHEPSHARSAMRKSCRSPG